MYSARALFSSKARSASAWRLSALLQLATM